MKKRFLILLSLGIIAFPSITVQAKDSYKECASYDSNNGKVVVAVNSAIKSSIELRVTNTSDRAIHDLKLYSNKDTRFVLSDTSVFIGELKPRETKVVSIKAINLGSGSVQRFINDIGGLQSFIPLFIISVASVSFLFFAMKGRKQFCYMQVVIAMTAGLFFVSSDIPVENKPNVTIEVTNALRMNASDKEVEYRGVLEFFEDILSVEEYVVEEEVSFNTTYKLVPTKKVTEDQKVKSEGRKGKHVKTYEISYVNGEEVSRELVSDEITVQPNDEVIEQGTLRVIKKETVEPEKVYIPDDTLELGVIELDTSLTGMKDKTGESETTYYWDEESNSVKHRKLIVIDPGKEYYKAGTLKVVEETLPAHNKYVPVENQEVGYINEVKEKHDGLITRYYRVNIDVKTGEPKKNTEEVFVKSERVDAVDGKVEVGVLQVQELNKGFKTVEKPAEDKWTSYREVTQKGEDTIVEAKTILNLNENTGICATTGKTTEKVIKEGKDEIIKVGTKEPNWVSLIELEEEISYNTRFVPCEDGTLTGDEQKTITEGENGRIYSEYLVACDDKGNELEGYDRKLISKDAIQDPVDEVIMVASDSIALQTPQALVDEDLVKGSLTQSDVDRAERWLIIAMCTLTFGLVLRLLPRRRYKSVLKATENAGLEDAEISDVRETLVLQEEESDNEQIQSRDLRGQSGKPEGEKI